MAGPDDRYPAVATHDAATDRPPSAWSGRDDGPGPEHARWHTVMTGWPPEPRLERADAVLIGFASDEGVRRNGGRVGAAEGPEALRGGLASLADPGLALADAGDVVVADGDLEAGQARLGAVVARVLEAGSLPVVLGGGHAVAYGSYRGWAAHLAGRPGERWGVLNIDAHFDLRADELPSSGTPFLQMASAEAAAGRDVRYAVVGISRANNTRVLFDAAAALGVPFLEDDSCTPDAVRAFLTPLLADVDRLHLSIDLDALPACVAPGVSAPAGFGIGLDAVRAAVRAVAASGKLGLLEVAELNPRFDVDARTARTAARLIDEALRTHAAANARPS
ncbi:formimidoylglutamase [Nigerium massiliense]|uniref:formimidoylglutamase n=1 Tax=Nigerium massiliense TaxID=1522317 RepID=UPI00058CAB97|nr:formimidoylglutamase [Nigerium massiliense]